MSKSRDLISAATLQNLEIFRMAIRQDLKEELRVELRDELIAELASTQAAVSLNLSVAVTTRPVDDAMGIAARCNAGLMTKKAAILALHALHPEIAGCHIARLLGCHQTYACAVIAGRC